MEMRKMSKKKVSPTFKNPIIIWVVSITKVEDMRHNYRYSYIVKYQIRLIKTGREIF